MTRPDILSNFLIDFAPFMHRLGGSRTDTFMTWYINLPSEIVDGTLVYVKCPYFDPVSMIDNQPIYSINDARIAQTICRAIRDVILGIWPN